ncbi:hypothetical protein KU73_17285 [Pectobacterium wasabiae]|uniref:Uncharacterized protein n=2 Tax=Pectobacterium wasabiae TaxID=55208 RepID=A0ABR4V8V2_9GAMM|nr:MULTISPECIES: hypothetical protein [Pectobacterium]AOR63229.1 hypothetical protein A7983_08160 [Pectobacterium wasabiae CFBP 3304]EJS96193.1 Hypothetical protein Y17_0552 [Pectobacterium wasabiae CFBP 3304]KGA27404.1 hypothetical protein KU73_17285 [Pectobacterium wasabiae]
MFHFNRIDGVEVVSMIAANPGWYLRVKENGSDEEWWYMPVACWALCRSEDGDMMLPCVPDDRGTLTPNDPDANPCDLVYLPDAKPVESKRFGDLGCDIVQPDIE